MLLPRGHIYRNKTPTVSDDTLMYLNIGASIGIGSVDSPIPQTYNTNRTFIYKHNDTIVGFADPTNQQNGTSPYPNLKETGTQNYNSFLVNQMRLTCNKKICLVQGGQSTIGITNTETGFNSDLIMGQIEDLCAAARAKVKTGFKFALVNVTDGDSRFGATGAQMGTAFNSFSANLRAAANNPNLPIIMVGLGPKPQYEGTDPYPSWVTHREYFKHTYSAPNFYYVMTDDLDQATYVDSDTIHWNALGYIKIAKRINNLLQYLNIIPNDETINIALSGQSNAGSLGGSTESGSTAGIEATVAALESYYPNKAINWYKGTDGGSGSDETTNADEYWWHTANNIRGTELQDFLEGSYARHDFIYHDLVATDANSEITQEEYNAIQLKIFREMWCVSPQAKIILRSAARRTSFSNAGGYQVIRDAQKALAASDARINRYMELYAFTLHDTVHVDDDDLPLEGDLLADAVADIKGYPISSGIRGASISSAVLSGDTVTVTISHESGTGFTPTSGIQGFKCFDDGVEVAITTAVGDGINAITLTLESSPSGVVVLYYGYDAMTELNNSGAIVSGIVRDNSARTLPLQTAKITL